jgi:hypothetical protein
MVTRSVIAAGSKRADTTVRSTNEPLEVCCVLVGDWPGSNVAYRALVPDLGAHYVQKLKGMLDKYAPADLNWRFTCFTDRVTINGVSCRPVPQGLYSYFNKLWLFSPSSFPIGSRCLFFDLDTCMVGDWEPLTKLPLDKPIFLRDLWAEPVLATGLMSWLTTLDTQRIWNDFEPLSNRRPPYFRPTLAKSGNGTIDVRTDEQWLYPYFPTGSWSAFQDLLPGMFASYKVDILCSMRRNGEIMPAMTAERARALRVVYFHGRPRPHEVKAPWNPYYLGG